MPPARITLQTALAGHMATDFAVQDTPVLQLNHVSRVFGDGRIIAVDDFSLDVHRGEIVSILGPSGCGKTTTMRLIAGLDEPTEGDIRVHGRSVVGQPPHRRNIGLVFQSLAIFPHMSVHRNVAFGLRMKRMAKETIDRKVEETLDLVRLPHRDYAARMPSQLSGGQLQRVALARTLATEPSLVLFDEPMAALDRRLRDYMAVELRKIQKQLDVAAVYVTHDQETASAMSDRIVIMESGKLIQSGSPVEIYERPANRFVAEFLGDINFIESTAIEDGENGSRMARIADGALAIADGDGSRRDSGTVFVRPEHVALSQQQSATAGLCGEIVEIQFNSGFYRSRVRLSDGQDILATSTDDSPLKDGIGSRVWIGAVDGRVRVLRP